MRIVKIRNLCTLLFFVLIIVFFCFDTSSIHQLLFYFWTFTPLWGYLFLKTSMLNRYLKAQFLCYAVLLKLIICSNCLRKSFLNSCLISVVFLHNFHIFELKNNQKLLTIVLLFILLKIDAFCWNVWSLFWLKLGLKFVKTPHFFISKMEPNMLFSQPCLTLPKVQTHKLLT